MRGVLIGAAAAATLIVAGALALGPRPGGGPEPDGEQRQADAPARPERPPEIVDREVRDVTPRGVTLGPRVAGPLVRIPPPPALPKPKSKPKARTERLFNPVVAAAGAIETASGLIRLDGIEAPAAEAMCGEGGAAWPCGRAARAALRRFIRGRAIECDVPAWAAAVPETTRCTVGGDDIAGWLAAQGWAAAESGPYRAAADAARAAKRGLWGAGPT